MDDSNGIEVIGLVKQFKNGPRAVDGIDLEVEPGEIYGFLGPNGAGKSTTVHMLTTLLPPTAGTARVAGLDVAKQGPEVRKVIGAALQEAALDPHLTGSEHMKLQTALHGLPKNERIKRGEELIERVGLSDAAGRRVGAYSGGMKRRLDLALALVHRPRVLFLDEPTTGLDPQSRSSLWSEVTRLSAEDGVTVFLTTQYLEEADQLANRIGIIDDGRIVAEGTPAALKSEIGRPSVEVVPRDPVRCGEARTILDDFGTRVPAARDILAIRLNEGIDELVGIVRAFDAADIELASLVLNEPTLDDVFLEKTGRHLEGSGEADSGEMALPQAQGAAELAVSQ
ncbi:MAG: ATP-binding cassette domain-containing protein [Thermoleophilia bacterium]|nr:ATP-binding cassette domain-containing protein [Thermoleophilia bacterium]